MVISPELISVSAEIRATDLPAPTLPVSEIMAIPGCSHSATPVVPP